MSRIESSFRRRHSQHRLISCARLSQAVDCACCLAGLTAQRVESCLHSSLIYILIQVSSSSSRLHHWHWVVGNLSYTARLSCTQTCTTVCGYICGYAESFHRRSRQTIRWHNDTPTVLSSDTTQHQVLMCVRKLSENQLNLNRSTKNEWKLQPNKKLCYRRETARCVVSIEILPIATQQCRNYLYDKPWPNRWYEVGDLVGGNAW